MLGSHAFGGEPVDVRRLTALAAVATDPLLAEVVEQHDDDVQRFRRSVGGESRGGEKKRGKEDRAGAT
jgi:hypothetical protein